MTQMVYGLVKDGGDGSASMCWFREDQRAEAEVLLLDEEEFFMNEGGFAVVLEFPDDLDLEQAGFSFYLEND